MSGGNVTIYLGSGSATGAWTRFERNVQQDYEAYEATLTWQETNALFCTPGDSPLSVYSFEDTHYMYLDDISLSNAQTTEHNVLGPGVIGHVLRHRTINPATYAATDKWFAYDQVGSVIGELNSGGLRTAQHFQDAFGNVLESWNTGLWDGGADGFHHNTKEVDTDAGAYYMAWRWYDPSTGSFRSSAPYPAPAEERYSAFGSNPVALLDPMGMNYGPYSIGGAVPTQSEVLEGAVVGGAKGAAALIDGIIPFADPCASLGLYSFEHDPGTKLSHAMGPLVTLPTGGAGAVKWLRPPLRYCEFGKCAEFAKWAAKHPLWRRIGRLGSTAGTDMKSHSWWIVGKGGIVFDATLPRWRCLFLRAEHSRIVNKVFREEPEVTKFVKGQLVR